MLGRTAFALSLVLLVACGDDTDASGGTTTSTATTGSGGNGSATTTSSTSSGGDGGSGATCGPDIAFTSFYGCDVDALTDATGESEVTIGYGYDGTDMIYSPKCLHVCAGTTVTFEPIDGTNFQIHPLQGGEPPSGDPESPFGYLGDPDVTEASFTLPSPGSHPYYCIAHISQNMTGVVYVQ